MPTLHFQPITKSCWFYFQTLLDPTHFSSSFSTALVKAASLSHLGSCSRLSGPRTSSAALQFRLHCSQSSVSLKAHTFSPLNPLMAPPFPSEQSPSSFRSSQSFPWLILQSLSPSHATLQPYWASLSSSKTHCFSYLQVFALTRPLPTGSRLGAIKLQIEKTLWFLLWLLLTVKCFHSPFLWTPDPYFHLSSTSSLIWTFNRHLKITHVQNWFPLSTYTPILLNPCTH